MRYITCCVLIFLGITRSNTQAQIITTIAGTGGISGYSGDGGPATAAQLYYPSCGLPDGLGNVYVMDEGNNVVRKINSLGIITTVVGNGYGAGIHIGGFFGDGGPATAAEMYGPCDIAFDKLGNLYIADNGNHAIRKVTATGIISTVAGTGAVPGYSGDGGQATSAKLYGPTGVAIDTAGNIFIAEQANQIIRKVSISSIISTVAGIGSLGYSGDNGPATLATFAYPTSLVVDKHGNIFISDQDNHCIRKVSSAGIITTVAGTGIAGYGGDGGPATSALLNNCVGVAIDSSDNLYIGDAFNNVIRKVNASGIITTIAGTGIYGYLGDNGPATACEFRKPYNLRFDSNNSLFISDYWNNVIRKITFPGGPEEINKAHCDNIEIYPNPAVADIRISDAAGSDVVLIDMLGRAVLRYTCRSAVETINIAHLPSGLYIAQFSNREGERRNIRVVKK